MSTLGAVGAKDRASDNLEAFSAMKTMLNLAWF